VPMPFRARSIDLHPTLSIAYAIYEFEGLIGVWTWPRCSDFAAARPHELERVPAALERAHGPYVYPETQQFGLAPMTRGAPTRLMVAARRGYVFTCTRNFPSTTLGTYTVRADGTLALVSFTSGTGGWNVRECALSPDEEWLVELDSSSGQLSAYHIGEDGQLTLSAAVTGVLEYPSSLTIWAADEQCYDDAGVEATGIEHDEL
jgi:6-phosphogluconolactonase (cycloisomerase 2 family)